MAAPSALSPKNTIIPFEVIFAPDWRKGVPYQRLLAENLENQGVHVSFLSDYKRVFPLSRMMRERSCDVLHLHWPEAYFTSAAGVDWFRRARFRLDLAQATRRCALVVTAHNLQPHDRRGDTFIFGNSRAAFRRAAAVIAHSHEAREQLITCCGLDRERVHVVAIGDLAAAMPAPPSRIEARSQLALGNEQICLMFGVVQPYKGLEEVLECWRQHSPDALLVIAGEPINAAYGEQIERAAQGMRARLRLARLDDAELAQWLSAADCVLFNYRDVFTSGAAALARSWGVPILLPARLTTVALDEPSPYVLRFQNLGEELPGLLMRALATPSDYSAGAGWRQATAWHHIAEQTISVYREATRHRASVLNTL
jgi:glycosyltransferase involved in cell wall biosynthesis